MGLNAGTLIPYFNSPDLYIVGGAIIRTQGGTLPTSTISTVSGVTTVTASTTAGATTTQTIYLTGNISDGTQPAVEDVLQNALNKSSNGMIMKLYYYEVVIFITYRFFRFVFYEMNLIFGSGSSGEISYQLIYKVWNKSTIVVLRYF